MEKSTPAKRTETTFAHLAPLCTCCRTCQTGIPCDGVVLDKICDRRCTGEGECYKNRLA